jgi:putative RecB family exonuclease
MASYSNSRLNTFKQCRYKFKLEYIDQVEAEIPTTVEAFMGGLVHLALEKLYKDLKFQKLNTLPELIKFFNDTWKKEWTKEILVVKKQYSAENYRKMGEKYITDYYNTYKPFDDMTILGIETKDMIHLPDGSHYHIRIDKFGCVGDTYYVCDYKTNMHMKDQAEADEDKQLAMYSIWVKNNFKDAKKIVLKWHMLAFNKEVTSERTEKQLKQLQDETIKLIKEMEKCKEFPTSVSSLCDYCGYKPICPAFVHAVALEKKTPAEFKKDDGVKLVDAYSTLNQARKETEMKLEEIKEKLIQFAVQKGLEIVYGSNMKTSVKPTLRVVYPEDKDKIIQLLKKKGLYDEFVSLNYPKLTSKILSKEIDAAIIKLTKAEKDYRVSLSKKKEEEE